MILLKYVYNIRSIAIA